MTNLKEINFGINKYCGPAVLSALTGESTDRCAAVISSINGQSEIKAVQIDHLLEAFRRLGFRNLIISDIGRTLYSTLIKISNVDGFYMIMVPNHFVAVEVKDSKIYLIDNHTKEPMNAASSARLMQVVQSCYKIIPKLQPKFIEFIVELVHRDRTITVFRTTKFEDAADNSTVRLGSFSFIDYEELKQIVSELKKLVK